MSEHRTKAPGKWEHRCARSDIYPSTVSHIPTQDAARKFGRKSLSLYETKDALEFLEDLNNPIPSTSSSSSSSQPASPRTPSSTSTPTSSRDDSERVAVVRRIRACKATEYYEIMGLQRGCTDGEIKKAYRKVHTIINADGRSSF